MELESGIDLAATDQNDYYNRKIKDLMSEVERLEKKLEKTHSSDLNALDRAYGSLCQHIDALELESRGMAEGIAGIHPTLVTPECIAEELSAMGMTAGCLLLARHFLGLVPGHGAAVLYNGCWVAGAAYISWRLTFGVLRRLSNITTNNRKRKLELQSIWEGLSERIRILKTLACSGPRTTGDQGASKAVTSMGPTASYLPASQPPGTDEAGSLQQQAPPTSSSQRPLTRTALVAEGMAQAGAMGNDKITAAKS